MKTKPIKEFVPGEVYKELNEFYLVLEVGALTVMALSSMTVLTNTPLRMVLEKEVYKITTFQFEPA